MDRNIFEIISNNLNIELIDMIISNPPAGSELRKIKIRPVLIKQKLIFQASEFRDKQVFHSNYTKEELLDKLSEWLDLFMKQVIRECNMLAVRYGYDKLTFMEGDIASYEGVSRVDMVVTLHACDTATDYALHKAIIWNADVILAVPCCQHELNTRISNDICNPLFRYGLIKERIAALTTDALRAELLEIAGYKAQILEFIDMEHTPKNILIRAVKKNSFKNNAPAMLKRLNAYEQCRSFFKVEPTLYKLLSGQFISRMQ